jgi:rod shape-determining protein MreB and related proteins
MNREVFLVGMDFGSFKTSVVASNGKRETLLTAVGWPKDHVARSLLQRDVVFGTDIVRQRLALNVVRPFAKGALKYLDNDQAGVTTADLAQRQRAAKLLVKHVIGLIEPPSDALIFGVVGAPSRASNVGKRLLIEAVRGVFDAVVIVAEPFTVAYSMNRLMETLVVDIGAGTIDICPIYGTYPKDEDQVTLPIGGDTIDETFRNSLRKLHPEMQLSLNMAREIKEKHGFVHDSNENVVVSLPVSGVPTPFDVTDVLKDACQSVVAPIVDGIREVIARFDPEFLRPMLNNILLGGGGSQLRGLDRLLEQSLQPLDGATVTKVYDSVFAGAVGALKLAMTMPTQNWEQLRSADAPRETETRPLARAA